MWFDDLKDNIYNAIAQFCLKRCWAHARTIYLVLMQFSSREELNGYFEEIEKLHQAGIYSNKYL